jgi:GTPase SAR1 family protein
MMLLDFYQKTDILNTMKWGQYTPEGIMSGEKKYSQDFDRKINNLSDVRTFLLANPFTNDPHLNFNRLLNDEYFFEHFFSFQKNAEKAIEDIKQAIREEHQTLIITGYKGCGKTTFINYLCRNKDRKSVNFDRTSITTDSIKSHLVLEIYDDICKDSERKFEIQNSMIEVFFNDHSRKFIDRKIDPRNAIANFLKYCDSAILHPKIEDEDRDKTKYSRIKDLLNEMDINQLLSVLLFWYISSWIINEDQKKQSDKFYFVFDNLDAIHETKELDNLMREFTAFLNNAPYIINNISHPKLVEGKSNIYNAFQDFIFIFVMRETTKSSIAEHFNDRHFDRYHRDVSTIFLKESFVEKRNDYLQNNKNIDNPGLSKIIECLNELVHDSYFKKNLFPLFNHDYRTSVELLAAVFDDAEELEDYQILLRSKIDFIRYGARGILFRKIFNLFSEESYFNRLIATEISISGQSKRASAINMSRLLLTYIVNHSYEYREKEYGNTKPGVALFDVFKEFQPGIDDLKKVVNTLWTLFSLRDSTYWNHLITFDYLSELKLEQLENELENFENGRMDYNNSPKIRISCAGRVYLDTVLEHYEYFAARRYGDDHEPLFYLASKGSYDLALIDNMLQEVFGDVKNCIERLGNFNCFFREKMGFEDDASFLGSRFCYHKVDEEETYRVNSYFHGERIIHSHINYIDSFRRFLLMKMKDDKSRINANKRIVNVLENYINLFSRDNDAGVDKNTGIQPASESTREHIKKYNACITKIKYSGYENFETAIDRKTGQKLIV